MHALRYSLQLAGKVGWRKLYERLRAKNACKTCALGMGGQAGGMVNEAGHFPSVCKKSMQAQAADMQPAIPEAFLAATPLVRLARMSSAELENLGRVGFPLVAEPGDSHFRRVSWDQAFELAAQAMRVTPPGRFFHYVSGRASNEAGFLAQLFVRAYGSPNIHNCSYYCHQASGVALTKVYGSGTASIQLDDLAKADLAVVIGANPASNHPRLLTELMRLRRRGGRVIVINPLKELGLVRFRVPSDWRSMLLGTDVADLFLQPRVGSDVALLKALLKGLIEIGAVDQTYIDAHTQDFAAVRDDVAATSWPTLEAACGVPRAALAAAVDMLATAHRGICMWAMGLTHHEHGVANILALANLALARGWLGREGAGLLPIRGHSNVQGIGSVGVAPAVKDAFARNLEQTFHIQVPREPGLDTYASMEAAHAGTIQTALLQGGNLYGSNPDSAWAAEALRRIDTLVHISTKLNTGHVCARGRTTLILPALARDEEPQATTQESMFSFVRLSDGGTANVAGDMRSEVYIVAQLAERVLPKAGIDWQGLQDHRALRRTMAQVVPGLDALGQIDTSREEFQIPGRIYHVPNFATPDRRAHFHVTPLPDRLNGGFDLMTLRSEGQFNTVVYDEEDLYRGNTSREVVMMAAADAERLGLHEGDRVRVVTATGALEVAVALVDISPGGLAMYYPEANVLIPRRLDPLSKTPAFKSVAARLEPVRARQAV